MELNTMFNQVSIGRFVVKLSPSEEAYFGSKLFRQRHGFKFLVDRHDCIRWDAISHDYLHMITNIPPTPQGEDEISALSYLLYAGKGDKELRDKLRIADSAESIETYKRLYALGI